MADAIPVLQPITRRTQQLTMFVSDYERLADQRDIAAYRALGAMTAAIVFCREQKVEDALAVMTRALENYERADSVLQSLKTRTQ